MAAAHLRGAAGCAPVGPSARGSRLLRSPPGAGAGALPPPPLSPSARAPAAATAAATAAGTAAASSAARSSPAVRKLRPRAVLCAATTPADNANAGAADQASARGPGVGGAGGGGSGRESPLPGQAEVVFGGGAAAAADEGLLALLTPGTASRSVADLDYLTELLAIQANDGPKSIALFGSRNMGLTHQQLVEVLACALVAAGNRIFTSGATGTNAAVIKGALRAIEGDGDGRAGGSGSGGGGGNEGGGGGGSALDAALASLGGGGAGAGASSSSAGAPSSGQAANDDDDDDPDPDAPSSAVASGRLRPSGGKGGAATADDDRLTVILPQSLARQPQESQELLARVGRVVEMPGNDGLALMDASRICNREIIASVQQVVCFAFRDSRLLLETCAEAKDAKKIVTLFYLD